MNCFYHPDSAATGLCRNCFRALCPTCITELPDGLACKGRCEEGVTRLLQLISKGNTAPANVLRIWSGASVVLILFGILFFYAGVTVLARALGRWNVITLAGLLLAICGVFFSIYTMAQKKRT